MDGATVFLGRSSQTAKIFEIVEISKKDRRSIVPALHHMNRYTGQKKPWFSRHPTTFISADGAPAIL
jgi:hypothetical protein